MFGAGSTPAFGQSSSSPFGSPSIFGQSSNSPNNPFAPKPFGNTTPFGAQTGGSIFGGTSTGVFGLTQPASPLTTAPAFGASPSQGFGSMPAFGASSTPAFGASSSASFGSSSVFGQTPAFNGFGSSNNTQANPFGGTFQQSQPAFGSSLFGSTTPFGAPSRPAFGASSSPAFGATSTPAFGSTATPAFGASTNPVFGSGGAFGQTSTPAFGASTTPSFGAASTPSFGAASTPAFGATSSPAFGASSTPAFGVSSAPSFSFGSSPAAFNQPTTFGGSPFGTSTTPFGAQSSPFGAQTTTPTFGNTPFGQPGFGSQTQRGGSRATPYAATIETDSGTTPPGKLESISAMPAYKEKSHDELRWEDYQLGDKGGPSQASQSSAGTVAFGGTAQQTNPFASASPFGQASSSTFTSTTASNPFAPKTPGFGSTFPASSTQSFVTSPFAASTSSNPFGTTSAPTPTPSIFGGSVSAFGASTSPSLFGSTGSLGFGSSPSASIFGSGPSSSSTSAFGTGLSFANTQSSPLFQSSTPSLGQTSVFGQSASSFGQSSAPAFGQTSLFSAPSTGFGGNLFSSTPLLSNNLFSQSTPSLSTPVQQAQPAQSSFGFGTFGQSQPAPGASLFGGGANTFSQNMFGQPLATQSPAAVQSVPMTSPFGTLPAMPQMSIGRNGSAPSVQYGISSLPVVEKPVQVRISSLLTSRHLSQRRIRLPARKYHPKNGVSKVPFFSDDEETSSTPKADALFIPRENPRALVIRPVDQWPSRSRVDNSSPMKEPSVLVQENGEIVVRASTSLNGSATEYNNKEHPVANGTTPKDNVRTQKTSLKSNGTHEDNNPNQKEDAAIINEHGAGIEAMMPKLCHPDYYTEPRVQELAAKERAEPGFCRNVKNFVVGRQGYGSIKFMGETDVRRLDLETLIQFNNREVIVYMDESKKPPVGQGLNKAAEVTLLNIKCFDKKTGQQVVDGTRVDRYKEMLKKKANDQGAEFVSYDPVKGEWKFRVNHFSRYGLML